MAISFIQAGQISAANVGSNILKNPTSLQFGPDGRLYVSEQNGDINAFTIAFQDGEYIPTAHEKLVLTNGTGVVKSIQNHNDDGSLNGNGNRQVTGIAVTGTAEEPVLYISSSDPRIAHFGEVNLDTNSGVVTKVSWNSTTEVWEAIDIIRGLPRSEENHAVNGMLLSPDGTKLYLMVGGNTNNGAPSSFFSYTAEYALSSTLLEIDLEAIEDLPTLEDPIGGKGGKTRNYKYDLPTLDDPNVENVNGGGGENAAGLDESGPWGGNDGLNQAILPADAPLRIYASGLRNAYDLAMTPDGKLYTVDNGSNNNLGGNPNTEAGDAEGDGVFGEAINSPNNGGEGDPEPLFLIEEGGYYGHPNPALANQNQSWTVYNDSGDPDTSVGVNKVDDISAGVPEGIQIAPGFLIDPSKFAAGAGQTLADLSPQQQEAKLLENGVRVKRSTLESNKIVTVGSSTNGIVAYDSKGLAFDGVLDGKLFVTQFNDNLTLLNLNSTGDGLTPVLEEGPDGIFGTHDDVVQSGGEDGILEVANNNLGVNLGNPLDVTVGPDGTLWVAEIGTNEITVLAPSNSVVSGDNDSDNDGIENVDDPFLRDASNGTSVVINPGQPTVWEFSQGAGSETPGPDGFGGGVTGVMIDGTTNFEEFFQAPSPRDGQVIELDNVKFVTAAGGGTTTIEEVTNGDPYKTPNDGQFLFHTGFQLAENVETFTVKWVVANPGAISGGSDITQKFQQIGGYIGDGTQSNYLKIVAIAFNNDASIANIQIALENSDTISQVINLPANDIFNNTVLVTDSLIVFELEIDPTAATAIPKATFTTKSGDVTITGGTSDVIDLTGSQVLDTILGNNTVQGQTTGIAAGLFASNTGSNSDTFQAVFDSITVTATEGQVAPDAVDDELSTSVNKELNIPVSDLLANDTDPNPADTLTVTSVSNPQNGTVSLENGVVTFSPDPDFSGAATFDYTITDGTANDTASVTVDVSDEVVLYRINAGGDYVPPLPSDPVQIGWVANKSTALGAKGFSHNAGSNISGHSIANLNDPSNRDASLPDYVPIQVFNHDRFDPSGDPEMLWSFDVTADYTYQVNLFLRNGFIGTSEAGERIFDIEIEGIQYFSDIDLSGTYGHEVAAMLSQTLVVKDDSLDIEFLHDVQNPMINAIEIVQIGKDITPSLPVVNILGGNKVINENSGQAFISIATNFTVPNDENVSVNFQIEPIGNTIPGTGGDYKYNSTSATFGGGVYTDTKSIAGGSADLQIPIDILDDNIEELGEAFKLTILSVSPNATLGANSEATVTIQDVEPESPGYFEVTGSSDNQYFKIQIEDAAALNGGTSPNGNWNYVTVPDNEGRQTGFQGSGYYLYGSNTSTAFNPVKEDEILEFEIEVPQSLIGQTMTFRARASRDGLAAMNQQNDIWLNVIHKDGTGSIEEFLVETVDEAERVNKEFIKVYGGPNNGNWGYAKTVDGLPNNFPAQIAFPEAGRYILQVAGRSEGLHIDFIELFTGSLESTASNSTYVSTGPQPFNGDSFNGTPPNNDDFSNDNTNPDDVVLNPGSNTLVAGQEPGDNDYITFEVPAGQQLIAANLISYEGGTNATFLGIATDTTFTSENDLINNGASLEGGTIYDETAVDSDLLPLLASNQVEGDGTPTIGLSLPLGPGLYTVWFGQNGTPSSVSTVELVTEAISIDQTLSVTLEPTSIFEDGGTVTGTVTRNTNYTNNELTVTLSSDDISEATVPNTVTIPIDATSATFEVTVQEDTELDNAQTAKITATASGFEDGTASLEVLDNDAINTTIRIEAEDITNVTKYRLESKNAASEGQVLSLVGSGVAETGTATFIFTGETGFYDINLGTFDESDGAASFTVEQNGTQIGQTIVLDQNITGSAAPNNTTHVTRLVEKSIQLVKGDTITVTGFEQGGEHARFDFIEFTSSLPTANDDVVTTDETNIISGNVLDNDTGTIPLTVIEVNGSDANVGIPITLSSGALLTLNADGSFDYDPNGEFDELISGETDTDSFTYLAANDQGVSEATVTVTINGVDTIRIEAEDITNVTKYRLESKNAASEGQMLSLVGSGVAETGTATFIFTGETGFYDINLGTFDESDGTASFTVEQNGTQIGQTIVLDQNITGSGAPNNTTHVTRLVEKDIQLVKGDTIKVTGFEQGGEHARFDFIEFTSSSGSNPTPPPADDDDDLAEGPDFGLEVLESLNVNDGIATGGVYTDDQVGAAELSVMANVNKIQSSNFVAGSFQLTNTGDKKIAAVFIDFRDAVFGDSVVDFNGTGGDTAAKKFVVDSGGTDQTTGAFFDVIDSNVYYLPGEPPLKNTTGKGKNSSGGFRGLLLKAGNTTGNGFETGETVGFSGDMDPNSIAGLQPSPLKDGAISSWDVGGISGAEIAGSRFFVLFDDGTTASGVLANNDTQAGSIGEAVEGQTEVPINVIVNNGSGTYGENGAEPTILVTGPAGQSVQVVLAKGFQPVTNNEDGHKTLVEARLAQSQPEFPVNNAFDFQTVSVVIGQNGTLTIPAGAFNYNETESDVEFAGDNVTPIAISAVAINDEGVATGPVAREYLINSTQTPVIATPVIPSVNLSVTPTVGTEAEGTVITLTATASSTVVGSQTVDLDLSSSSITNADFEGTIPNKITIANGKKKGNVKLTVADDAEIEGIETAAFTISNPSSGLLLGPDDLATVTIKDNDPSLVTVLLEAEAADEIVNYRTEIYGIASGGEVLSFKGAPSGETGSASFTFTGASGNYNVELGTFDENDGEAEFTLDFTDSETDITSSIGSIVLNDNLGSGAANASTFVELAVATEISLTPGDILTVNAFEDGFEHARLDYLKLEPTI